MRRRQSGGRGGRTSSVPTGVTGAVAIPPTILAKLDVWCSLPSPHSACISIRRAIAMHRRARETHEESSTARVIAALYLLLVRDAHPLTSSERDLLERCLHSQPPLDASTRAA